MYVQMYKRPRVTANQIVNALYKNNKKKYIYEHGDGYLVADLGKQNIGILGGIGADRWRTADDSFTAATRGTFKNRRFTNPNSYSGLFDFNKIPYAANSATAVSYGSMPPGTYCNVLKTSTQFFLGNSSTSTMYVYLYELCPRRNLTDTGSIGVAEALYNQDPSNDDDYSKWTSVGQNETGEQYAVTGDPWDTELTPTTPGVVPFDCKTLVQDFVVNNMGVKVLEPGENTSFKVKRGKYKFLYGDVGAESLYYDKDHFRMYLVRIHGEPVSSYVDAGAVGSTAEDVPVTQISPCKLIWTWVHKTYFDLPPFIQYGQQVVGSTLPTSTGGYLNGTTPLTLTKQVMAIAPEDEGGAAGTQPSII